jgi:tetratricopeptide (TPR) repeat protein
MDSEQHKQFIPQDDIEIDDDPLPGEEIAEHGDLNDPESALQKLGLASSSQQPDAQIGCVLLVDSASGTLRAEMIAHLEESGFMVREAQSVTDAVEILVNEPIRVLLHNWRSVNGADAIKMHRKLYSDREYDQIVRVVMIEQTSPEFMALVYDLGVDRVFDNTVLEQDIPAKLVQSCREKDEDLEFSALMGAGLEDVSYDQHDLDGRVLAAYESHSDKRRVQLEYGSYLIRSGKWDDAEALAKDLVDQSQDDVRCMNFLARVYMKQGRFSRAVEILYRADVINPCHPERLVMIGDALFEKGEVHQAKENYERAIEIDPDLGAAHNGLGMTLVTLGDLEAALSCFKKCLSEDETASFFNNAAVLATKSDRSAEGLKLYEAALKSLQTDKYAHIILFNIGLAFYRIQDFDQATEALKASLQYMPGYEKSRRLLERILLRAG